MLIRSMKRNILIIIIIYTCNIIYQCVNYFNRQLWQIVRISRESAVSFILKRLFHQLDYGHSDTETLRKTKHFGRNFHD